MMPPVAMALGAVLCIACGQILFKMTAQRILGRQFSEIVGDWTTILIFGTALAIYSGATVLWVLALRHLPLAQAYMLMTLSFILVPIAAVFVFGERLSFSFLIGLALIISGIFMTFGIRL